MNTVRPLLLKHATSVVDEDSGVILNLKDDFDSIRKSLEPDRVDYSEETVRDLGKVAISAIEGRFNDDDFIRFNLLLPFFREFPSLRSSDIPAIRKCGPRRLGRPLGQETTDVTSSLTRIEHGSNAHHAYFAYAADALDRLAGDELVSTVRRLLAFVDRAGELIPQSGVRFDRYFGLAESDESYEPDDLIGMPEHFDFMSPEKFDATCGAVSAAMNMFDVGSEDLDELFEYLSEEVERSGEERGVSLHLSWMDEYMCFDLNLADDLCVFGVEVDDYCFVGERSPAYMIFKCDDDNGLWYPYDFFVDIAG